MWCPLELYYSKKPTTATHPNPSILYLILPTILNLCFKIRVPHIKRGKDQIAIESFYNKDVSSFPIPHSLNGLWLLTYLGVSLSVLFYLDLLWQYLCIFFKKKWLLFHTRTKWEYVRCRTGLETLFKSNYDLKIKFLRDIYNFLPPAYIAPSVQCLIVVCCPLPNFSPSMFLNGIFCFFFPTRHENIGSSSPSILP